MTQPNSRPIFGSILRDGGCEFSVWAPNARDVSVIGDFNGWNADAHPLNGVSNGRWELFVPGVQKGQKYKFAIRGQDGHVTEKADPYAFLAEVPPKTASVVWNLDYEWRDQNWMQERVTTQAFNRAMSIYELHLGSWKRHDGEFYSYRELAELLPTYVRQLGFTHVEFMPIMEHPFFGSWGYQVSGYFAPSARYGSPQDLMYLIDQLHHDGIGVILDWVPSHFPEDQFALARFDGTRLFEDPDERKGYHPDWKSLIFNYGRDEIKKFLIANALYWLEYFHVDGLRVDAVASMLYLDYSRKHGEWTPNRFGGRENLEAIQFFKELNETIYARFPDVHVIAEESTAWPLVSRPTYIGGLGFGMKWDMGWMHDTLSYFKENPIHRKYHHDKLTFRMIYAFNENFLLSLSHDEVVHGKGSLYQKMPGDDWQKRANLRCLFANLFAQPGKKLIFMGAEFGQKKEWNHDGELEWDLLQNMDHAALSALMRDLNQLYRDEPALHATDFEPSGFRWLNHHDADQSVLCFMRQWGTERILVIANYTPLPRYGYRIGVESDQGWRVALNTDLPKYGGTGDFLRESVIPEAVSIHSQSWSIQIDLPPLATLFLKLKEEA